MIDWDRLEELKREIGEEDFAEVAEMFLEEMSQMLDRLAADPAAATRADFHELRGSASNLGLGRFASQCAEAEAQVARGRPADLPALIALYEASLKAASDALPAIPRAA